MPTDGDSLAQLPSRPVTVAFGLQDEPCNVHARQAINLEHVLDRVDMKQTPFRLKERQQQKTHFPSYPPFQGLVS